MQLHDQWGRQFHYLRLSLTDACNMRCRYCLPDGYHPTHKHFLNCDEARRLVTAFAALGTQKVRLTGGEPALRKDLPEIIAQTKTIPGIKTVAVTTNGLQLRRHLPHWQQAGLDQINISVDSLNANDFALITGHNRLQQILTDIDDALANNWRIKVNTVLMNSHTKQQLPRFLEWLRERPLTLRFIELMRTNDNVGFYEQEHLRGSDWLTQLQQQGWQELVRPKDAGPARELWHPDFAGKIGFILPYSPDFCSDCNRLRISATGDLHLCLFAEQGYSVRDLLQNDADIPALMTRLQELLKLKGEHHPLHHEQSGNNQHFAAIGG